MIGFTKNAYGENFDHGICIDRINPQRVLTVGMQRFQVFKSNGPG